MEECCLLVHSHGLLSLFSYTTKNLCPGSPASSDGGDSLANSPSSQVTVAHVKLTYTNQPHFQPLKNVKACDCSPHILWLFPAEQSAGMFPSLFDDLIGFKRANFCTLQNGINCRKQSCFDECQVLKIT